jgi:hypothetical protein
MLYFLYLLLQSRQTGTSRLFNPPNPLRHAGFAAQPLRPRFLRAMTWQAALACARPICLPAPTILLPLRPNVKSTFRFILLNFVA